jgi:hypothetical protein
LTVSAFTLRLGFVGRVEVIHISEIGSHVDTSDVGKDALVFNDFNREVTVSGYDTAGETKFFRIFSPAMRYDFIPQTGKTVFFIIHQGVHLPHLEHNLLNTIQMILYAVTLNETPKFQFFEPTNLSHAISVRGGNVDDVLVIPLGLHGVVSCFETFKPTKE